MRKAITLLALLLAFISMQVSAQERQISGKVTSATDNLGIPGAAVQEVGSNNGVVTDLDGNYTIKVSAGTTQLKFTSVGMKTKMVEIGTQTKIDIIMSEDTKQLDEVVVTGLAIKREKRSLGYATTQVSSSQLTEGNNTNVIGALQGKIAGVNINSVSGAPGSSNRIVIRGGTSLLRNNQALMVVDGVIINNDNNRNGDDLNNQVDYGNRGNDFNPEDIESISVLKGPAATAIYGSAASNGAVVITTKKGRRVQSASKSKMDVQIHSNLTFSSILRLPEFQNTFGEGDIDNVYNDRRENFSWGLPFDGALRPWGQEIDGFQRVKPYSAIEDNTKDFFDMGVTATNTVSFGGGTEKSDYYLSVGAVNNKGIVPTMKYDKYNLHFNGSSELSNYFTTGINLNYTNISSVLPAGGQKEASIFDNLLQTPRDIPITESKDLDNIFNGYSDVTGLYGFYGAYTMNPYFVLQNFRNTNDVDRVFGAFTTSYHQLKWLTITDRLGVDNYSDRRYQKWKKYDYNPIDPFYAGNEQIYQGKYSEDLFNYLSLNNDLMATMEHSFTENIKGSLLLGQNIRQIRSSETFAATNAQGGLSIPGYYNLANSNGSPQTTNSIGNKNVMGYYFDLNMSYKSYLFLGVTGRTDKSSTLPKDNSAYFYPGVNASFVFSELMSEASREKVLSYGKIRASWAKVGNDADPYKTTNYYTKTLIDGGWGSTQFPLGTVAGFTTGDALGNPQITPEFTTAFEVGAELGFFKDRLSIDVSYYENKSTDQIINLSLPYSSGYASKVINTGEIQNKGIELAVRGTPILTKSGLKVELYGTYTHNENEVVSLYNGVDQLILGGFSGMSVTATVGKPYNAFYAIDLLTDPDGHVVVDPNTGLPQLTTNTVYKGSYMPKYLASFGANITYKNWTLGFLFDVRQGGVYYSRNKDIMDFVGTSIETTTNNREDYVWPNSVVLNPDGSYSANTTPFHQYDYYTSVIPSGQHFVDASYVKLREANLSFKLPSKWLEKTPFGTATLAVFGNNLLLWTPDSNVYGDPEQTQVVLQCTGI
ncbi:MAG: SusC/RagA family TonB-linked outer membrane protein [Bacteroidia bacterium]